MHFDIEKILDWDKQENDRKDMIDALMRSNRFTLLGEGRSRRTYLSPTKRFVLKFPMSEEGLIANEEEHNKYRSSLVTKPVYGVVYAPCRLYKHSILLMHACTAIGGFSDGCREAKKFHCKIDSLKKSELPDWCNAIDCHQVGMLSNGKMVAYDYADPEEWTERSNSYEPVKHILADSNDERLQ